METPSSGYNQVSQSYSPTRFQHDYPGLPQQNAAQLYWAEPPPPAYVPLPPNAPALNKKRSRMNLNRNI
jgi:hypothetical protein